MTHEELEVAVIIAITNAERSLINLPPITRLTQMLLNDADYIRPQARAAIATIREALSEPDKDMLRAGLNWHEHVKSDENYPVERGTFRAMLSASPLVAREERTERVDSGDRSS